MRPTLLLLLALPLLAEDKTEKRLSDHLIKANRQAVEMRERTQKKAVKAYGELDEHCKSINGRANVRTDTGIWGCVFAPLPINPPGTTTNR